MHELGYAVELVNTLLDYMDKEKLTEIHSVTLQVGEATGIIPRYMMECWPAAVEGTKLAETKLKIDYVLAKGICRNCDYEYPITLSHGVCPKCGCDEYDMNTGYEFEITEIRAR